jgi:predicted nucleic acid-binding protein
MPAAAEYARIVAIRTRAGRPISVEDAQIAAIARAGGLTLATRNTKDFSDIDELPLVDPWT